MPTEIPAAEVVTEPAATATPETPPQPQPSLAEIEALITELGITPGQVKGRLEASRKWEERAKTNTEAAAELAKIREANMTEEQKRAERETALVEQNAGLAAELARTKAAVTYGLTAEDLEALDGVPADKVDIVAARLAARPPVLPKAPSADGQGKVGAPIEGATQLTKEDLKGMAPADVVKALAEGRLVDVQGGTRV